jgi:hypothetical protein
MNDLTRKTMSLTIEQYERLRHYSRLGESFSDCIGRIIDYAESKGMTRETLYRDRNIPAPSVSGNRKAQ